MSRQVIDGPLPGLSFVVDRTENRGGPLVVFLHSAWGAFGDAPLGEEVMSTMDVATVHLPGWGLSKGIEHFDDISELALAMWWAVEQLSSEPVVLVGHCLGGAVAAEMAITQPTKVRGMVLSNSFGFFNSDYPGADIFGLLPKDVMHLVYLDPSGSVATTHYPSPTDAYERGLMAIRRVEVLGAASRFIFPLPDTNIAKRAYRLATVPMTVLFGETDGIVPSDLAFEWSAAFPHAQVKTIAQTAHMTPYESGVLGTEVSFLAAAAAR
ncbi:MAG: alpha/beta fold hydrolase [Ilumatobacteraceae bacterium]